jgi:hypothetical protein
MYRKDSRKDSSCYMLLLQESILLGPELLSSRFFVSNINMVSGFHLGLFGTVGYYLIPVILFSRTFKTESISRSWGEAMLRARFKLQDFAQNCVDLQYNKLYDYFIAILSAERLL